MMYAGIAAQRSFTEDGGFSVTVSLPLLVIGLFVGVTAGQGLEVNDRDVINAVRCRVRCLSVMQVTRKIPPHYILLKVLVLL